MKFFSFAFFLTVSFCVELSSSTSNVVELAEGENESCASQGVADVSLEECYEISQADTTPNAGHEFNSAVSPKGCIYSSGVYYFNRHESGLAHSNFNKLCLDGEFIMSNDKSYS